MSSEPVVDGGMPECMPKAESLQEAKDVGTLPMDISDTPPVVDTERGGGTSDEGRRPGSESSSLDLKVEVVEASKVPKSEEAPEGDEGDALDFQLSPVSSWPGLETSPVTTYALANYNFGRKDIECVGQEARGESNAKIAQHREKRFKERGMRRSVGAVVLVHTHEFPHILLLQQVSGEGGYYLPGGRLRPGESDEGGLQRKLTKKLCPKMDNPHAWDVGDTLSKWWTIDFSRRFYPYVPAHVTKPREELVLYSVSLPESFTFAVPQNLQLVAVPFFEIFGNEESYGNVIASVPALISRLNVTFS